MENKNSSKIISDIEYDKLKLLYKFSKMLHFIDHHALQDAKNANEKEFQGFLEYLKKDIEDHITKIKKLS